MTEYLPANDTSKPLPAADEGLRYVVEESPEYRALLPRLASPEPVDTWKAATRSYFLYLLKPEADGTESNALFVAGWEEDAPLSAQIITPDPGGGEPRVLDLRAP